MEVVEDGVWCLSVRVLGSDCGDVCIQQSPSVRTRSDTTRSWPSGKATTTNSKSCRYCAGDIGYVFHSLCDLRCVLQALREKHALDDEDDDCER